MSPPKPKILARIAGGYVFAVAMVVLLVWKFDLAALKSSFLGLVMMKVSTAAGMLLCGAALVLLSGRKIGKPTRLVTVAMAVVVVGLGTSVLGEYLFGWQLGIDQLLFGHPTDQSAPSQLGRMSPAAAFSFVLAGCSLLMASRPAGMRRRFPVLEALGTVLIVVGGLALLGSIIDEVFARRAWNYTGMAMHTAAGFMLLGGGFLALARSEDRLTWSLDGLITGGFVVGIAMLMTAAGMSYHFTSQLQQSATWVSHTQEVLKEIEEISTGIAALGSDQRNYINTGNEHLLEPEAATRQAIREDLDALRTLTADNPNQKPRLDQLAALIAQRVAWGEQTVAARRRQGLSAAELLIATGRGMALSDSIRQVTKELKSEEYALLYQRQKKEQLIATTTFLLLPLGVFLSLVMLSLGLFFMNADVTRRRMAELASIRLAAIVESSDDAIIGKDPNGIITSWNRGAEKIFGYTAGEIVGTSILRLIPTDRQDEEDHILATIRRGENMDHFETQRQTRNGRLIDVSITASPIKDAAGNITGVSKVARDISERKRAELAMSESEARFRMMANSIPQLAWIAQADGFIVWYNQRWYDYTGTTPEAMEGWGWQSVHDPEALPKVLERWKGAIGTGDVFDMELPLRGADGSFRTFLTRVMPVNDQSGKILQWFGTNTDISEQKRAEAAARNSEAQLQTIIENMDEGLVVSDLNGQVLKFNRAALDMHGFASLEECRRHLTEFADLFEIGATDGTLWSVNEWPLARILRGEKLHDLEARIRRIQTGRRRVFNYGGTLVQDSTGQPFMAIFSMSDITARKDAEEKLRAQLARLSLLDQITRATGERQDFQSILQVVIRNLEDNLPVDFCCACLHDEGAKAFKVVQVGVKSESIAMALAMEQHAVIPMDENGLSHCALGKLVYEPDMREIKFPFPQRLAGGGLCSLVIAPCRWKAKSWAF